MSPPPTVIVTETLDDTPAKWLAERVNLVWCSHEKTDELKRLLPTAEGLLVRTYTRVDATLLAGAPKLKVVGRAGVGLDNIDVPACRSRGVEVVYTPDANTQAVVEYVTGLMLDTFRPRTAMPAAVSAKEFHQLRKTQVGTQLDQLTLGILGFGRIGKRLGAVAHAIGMKVIAHDLLPESELRTAVDYPVEFVDMDTLLARSDVFTVHVDGRESNRNLINAAALAKLKPGALFINAARGMLVDAPALAAWAKHSAAAGGRAILDVHEPEPPPADYPLYRLGNVRLLPHLASRTHPALENMSWVVRDVLAVIEGKRPQFPAP
ncbi:MAG: phosphoglycerate dehydrogenase [Planctomycetes bacterium]|nr:phosphoglycerate dehydrogenase [Planctomycetota bacterium]